MFDNILFFPFMAAGNLLYLLVGALLLFFWVWMIIDCAKRKFKNDVEKIVWIVIVVLATWIGALVYYFVVRVYNPRGLNKK